MLFSRCLFGRCELHLNNVVIIYFRASMVLVKITEKTSHEFSILGKLKKKRKKKREMSTESLLSQA